jgi:Zn-dependent M16 (insulinase) family peptidase
MALDMLADVLVNQESAPVRKAIQDAGIGSDIYATNQSLLQNVFSIIVQNANPADKDKFVSIVNSTLEKVYKEKIDRETLSGSLNRTEFRLREGNDAQKGLTCMMRSMNCWLYTNNPFAPLEYEKQLSKIKQSISGNYLEEIMKHEIMENNYGVILVLKPEPGLEQELSAKTKTELESIKRKLSPAELDTLVDKTNILKALQQKEDSPEAIASIPMLELTDIKPEALWFEASSSSPDRESGQPYHPAAAPNSCDTRRLTSESDTRAGPCCHHSPACAIRWP